MTFTKVERENEIIWNSIQDSVFIRPAAYRLFVCGRGAERQRPTVDL